MELPPNWVREFSIVSVCIAHSTLAKQKSYMLAYEGRVRLELTDPDVCGQKFLLDPHALPTELLSWSHTFWYGKYQKV